LSCPSNKTYTKNQSVASPKKCSYVKGTPEKRIKVFEKCKELLKKFA
jgi:hypothetical protein